MGTFEFFMIRKSDVFLSDYLTDPEVVGSNPTGGNF